MATPGNLTAVLYGVKDLRIDERPIPTPGPREVLVKVNAVGVCGSDVHYYEHGRIGDFLVTAPLILGHEASGEVVSCGSEAARHSRGQRVALEPGVPCGGCNECLRGTYNLCPDMQFFATPPVDGAFAQYVVIHEAFAHPIPHDLSDEAGALIEPLSVGVWANRKACTTVGSRVLVTGCGPIGLLAAQVALASGAVDITIVDVNPGRLSQARTLGFATIEAPTSEDLADLAPDILIECTGATTVVGGALAALRPAGTAVLVGMGARPKQPLPTAVMQARELTVTGTFRYANTYPAAIALAASGQVKIDQLVGARLPLAETEAALRMGHTNPSVLKTIVFP